MRYSLKRMRLALGVSPLLVCAMTASATPPEIVHFTDVLSNGPLASPANPVLTAELSGGYSLGRVLFSGSLSSRTPSTWLIDSRVLITAPGGESMIFQPFASGTTYTTQPFASSRFFPGVSDTAGTWTFRFFELVDNGGIPQVDASWDITITFTDELPPPPTAVDLGVLQFPGDAAAQQTLASGQIGWFRFELQSGVSVAQRNSLDLVTLGSTIGGDVPNDVQMVLYNALGVLVAADDDSGPGFLSQLSFGFGERPADGDGLEFAGQNGSLVPGVYYLGVGASPLEVRNGPFQVSTLSAAAGTLSVGARAGSVPCPGDWNSSGFVDSQDFFDFLGAFFQNQPGADFNADGAVNSQDFFDFLVAFFAGC